MVFQQKDDVMIRKILLASACLAALAPAAWAHSFNVVMVVPDDLAQGARNDMAAAFLVASEERDGHANEESDGHLGGLDVYITLATVSDRARIDAADPDILALPLAGDARSGDAVVLGAMAADSSEATEFLSRPAGAGFAPFAARFSDRAGRAPGAEATAAYLAARRIDLAVRALESVDDRAELANLLK
jgi:hypothetical protein